jgi:hypothetical protein
MQTWTWKKTWQGYDVRLCLKLLLNILKEMMGTTIIYVPSET